MFVNKYLRYGRYAYFRPQLKLEISRTFVRLELLIANIELNRTLIRRHRVCSACVMNLGTFPTYAKQPRKQTCPRLRDELQE